MGGLPPAALAAPAPGERTISNAEVPLPRSPLSLAAGTAHQCRVLTATPCRVSERNLNPASQETKPPRREPQRQVEPVPRPVQPWGCKGRSPLHKITYSYPLPTGKGVGGMGERKHTKGKVGGRQRRQAPCRVQQPRAATTGEFFRPEQVPAEVPSMIHSGKVLRGSGDSFKSPPAFFFLHRKKACNFRKNVL